MLQPFVVFLVLVAVLMILASTFGIFWLYLLADTSMASRAERRRDLVRQVSFATILLCFVAILASYLFYLA